MASEGRGVGRQHPDLLLRPQPKRLEFGREQLSGKSSQSKPGTDKFTEAPFFLSLISSIEAKSFKKRVSQMSASKGFEPNPRAATFITYEERIDFI